ncbi:hypothetical protein Adt_01670 [Abeliophyllum distichum]|uniref:Eisosome protein SEG2 n=1 Tax=Abeliophyllum distichum TaxID=126358 RepID=A0ABD1VTN6_9LAMI
MGCFLGCFGGAKDPKRGKKRTNRVIPKQQNKVFQNVQQQSIISAEQSITEITTPTELVPELQNKPEGEEQLSPNPRKRVTFDSNVTTYEHVLVDESTDSLLGDDKAFEKEKVESLKTPSQIDDSISEEDTSVISSVASYPPNHRYHNVRDSNDEAEEEYGDSDLDDLDDYDDEDDHDDYDIDGQEVWAESVLTSSMESTTENSPSRLINEEVESHLINTSLLENKVERLSHKTNSRDRSVYVNSVLNPIENITQWKAVKSKGTKPPKENFKQVSDQSKYRNQDIAVNASLSNWLVPCEEAFSAKKTSHSELETMSQGSNSVLSYEDRPILGALTVDELKQISASSTPRKSPNRSFDEMPIIGTVGTYWYHSDSAKLPESVSSRKGIQNTSSKYKELFVK